MSTKTVRGKSSHSPSRLAAEAASAGDGETGSSFGHYDDDARAYVVTDPRTPTKWVNYIGTLDFGGFVDQTGGLNICKKDPANNRITGYRIDTPQNAMRGHTLYCRIKNAKGGYTVFSPFFTPTLTPWKKFECHMGLGYNRWVVRMNGLEFDIKLFIPAGASQVVTDVKVRNLTAADNVEVDLIPVVEFSHPDALKNLTNADWVPQTMKGKAVGEVITQYPHMAEGKRANFLTANLPMDSFTTDRNKLLGDHGYGTHAQPEALMAAEHLDNYEAPRADNGNSIAAILYRLGPLAKKQEARLILQLGQSTSVAAAADAIARFQDPQNVDAAFAALGDGWRKYLDHLRDVVTPDASLNRIINVLGPRQNHATFFWSRYLSLNQLGYGGDRGIGVRDTNQDLMGVLPYMPNQAREMIEKLLSVQRYDGSSMHQFNPLTMKASIGEGHPGSEQDFYSDDHLWNVLAVAEYVKETGDAAFLGKLIGYYDDAGTGEKRTGTVLEHLHRALAFTAGNLGRHGLPKLGWADWNDAFNMEGAESVFSACLYGKALLEMQDLMDVLGDVPSAQGYVEDYDRIKQNVNKHAWDGDWFVSYIDKDGKPVGSKQNTEGQIYLYTQAWAVMAGFAAPERAARAMQSVQEKLDTKHGIEIMTPAYQQMQPGISASTYTPGLKENGGIFLHPNPWAAIAEAMLGKGDRAVQIIDRINPLTKDTATYECQPDVFVQNMASDEHPQFGLARNPWLSGTVSWVNQATTKSILGIRPTYQGLMVDPAIPASWPGYEATRMFRGVACHIQVKRGVEADTAMTVDGQPVAGNVVPTALLAGKAKVDVVVKLGSKPSSSLIAMMAQASESRRAAAVAAQDAGPLNQDELHTITGAQAKAIYLFSRMLVHAQGLSATLDFPPTGVVTGAPTLSTSISPFGQVNHLLDAGRSIRFGKRTRFASTPMLCLTQGGRSQACLLSNLKREDEDEKGEEPQSYPDSLADEAVTVTLAPPSMIARYELEGVRVARTTISPELSGNEDAVSVPASVDVFELHNTTDGERTVTLVLPRPSLVNLTEKKLRAEQDNAFSGQGATCDQVHEEVQSATLRGVVMGSTKTGDRMVIAVPALVPAMAGVDIDVQPGFRTAAYKTDLLVDAQGRFTAHKAPEPTFECGAAIAVTVKLAAGARASIPFATVMDFPKQRYVDGRSFDRAYTRRFTDEKTRAVAMAEWALAEHTHWLARSAAIQSRVFDIVRGDAAYAKDRPAATRVVNLLLNEISYLLSNAAIWVEKGLAEFLECFDYPFLNSADVDWYSQLLLMVFPDKEKAICQKFIDSIADHDDTQVYFHWHAANAKMRVEVEEWKKLKALVDGGQTLAGDQAARFEYLEHEADIGDGKKGYNGRSLTHIKGAKKLKGSVSHDVGRLTAGNPMRGNVSEYDWFNTNFWVDLFPKLAQRVARDAKFISDPEFIAKNWQTLQTGYDYWIGLDRDADGIPEGNFGEVKNTFDNIKLFGYDSYSASMALAGYQAMIRMAEMLLGRATADAERDALRARIADCQARFAKARQTIETLWVRTRDENGSESGYFATCYDPKVEPGEFAVYPQGATLRTELVRGGYLSDDGSVDGARLGNHPSALQLSPGFDQAAVFDLLASYAGKTAPNEIANLTATIDRVGSVLDQLKKFRYADDDRGAVDRAKWQALANPGAMKLGPFINKAYVHGEMGRVLERTAQVYPELERNGYVAGGRIQDKLWELTSADGLQGNYPDRQAIFDALWAHKSFDVFTNQLDGLWAWIAMGENPDELVPPARVRMILTSIYENNRVTNGWATQRTADGKEVTSDQGKDVWIASNYVLAHMLDYCGMTEESKNVYKVMDEVLLQHDNTSTSPESIRPDENKFIVKGYPRPGAVWTQLPIFFFKAQKQAGKTTSTPAEMQAFMQGLFNPDNAALAAVRARDQGAMASLHWARKSGRIPYGLTRVRPGSGSGPALPGGGGAAGSVLA